MAILDQFLDLIDQLVIGPGVEILKEQHPSDEARDKTASTSDPVMIRS